MKIFITGGLGFVGRHLSEKLLSDGHQVTAVGRALSPTGRIDHRSFSYLAADTTRPGEWQARLPEQDVVINLTGRSIFMLWTATVRKEIYDSRILTTRNIAAGLAGAGPTLFFSTSAIGYYGDRGDDVLGENEPPGNDFLARVCQDWEGEALKARSERVRVVLPRFGVVLGRGGGAMASMLPAFKLFLGGQLGDGRQWFPWIHIDDLVDAYRLVISRPDIAGPVNWCAPQPVRNREFTEKLAARLKRPVMLPTPAFVMKTVLGEFGRTLIFSQRPQPTVLENAGFPFAHADLDSALEEIVGA